MDEKIRLLIVDDYPVVLSGLVAMLKNHADIDVVGVASNGKMAIEQAATLNPRVVLMNLLMPGMDGIETTRQIKKNTPDVNIIIFSGQTANEVIVPALNAGAIGYILKDASETELVQAIRQVAQGEACLHPTIVQHLIKQMHGGEEKQDLIKKLTNREIHVLKLITQGFTNQEIAASMKISAATVHSHVGHILSKLEVSSRTQAVVYAMRAGILNTPDEV